MVSKVIDKNNTSKATAYVDNYLVIGTDRKKVGDLNKHIGKHLTDIGLQIHEVSQASLEGEFIGLELRNNCFTVKSKRLWRLKSALQQLAKTPKCIGKLLEIVVGHITWCMLIRRGSLGFLNYTYRFIAGNYDKAACIPLSVRCELNNIKNLLPSFRVDCSAVWDDTLQASDASTTGLGVC